MDNINVVSLFDGISSGKLALDVDGIIVNSYYASEIDKHALKVSKHHHKDIIHIGDVRSLCLSDFPYVVHLLIGGSPCQSFSFSGKRNGMSTKDNIKILTLDHYLYLKEQGYEFEGQSYLFWEYIRILRLLKPKYFLLENVVMQKEWEAVITETLGVKPIKINSALVSAQNRQRLYWTNIPGVTQPEDKNISLYDILETDDLINPAAIRGRKLNKATILGRRLNERGCRDDYNKSIPISQCLEVRATNINKSNCLTTVQKDNVLTTLPIGRYPDAFKLKLPFRYYTVKECCRLQTVSDNYFEGIVSDSQAIKMLGNGWTIDVIAWILSFIKK